MELQALLVLCGVGVVGIAVVLLMGLFSASGTSYEEAIAQQRKAATELLALAENKNKPKKNKKSTKKLAKKEKKEVSSAATGSEPESEAPAESGIDEDPIPAPKPHVEFCPPVVVDVSRDTVPNVKIRKRGKDPKVKPILINKDDPSCVSDPSTPPSPSGSNHFEEIHPKDDFELLQSSLAAEKTEKKEEIIEKKEIKPPKQAKTTKTVAKQTGPPAPEVITEEVSRERHNSGEVPKEQRKAKKLEKRSISKEVIEPPKEELIEPLNVPQPTELTTDKLLKQAQTPVTTSAPAAPAAPSGGKNKKKKAEPNVLSLMAGDSSGVNVGELVRVVREAVLSRTEIQILTDALLNKQHDTLPEHSEWTEGPNDPMQKLKKQLADKEKQLADEMEASQALHAKLKELRSNLNAEKSRASAVRSAAEQASSVARAELHTLQARLQRLIEENHALSQEKQNILQSKLDVEVEAQAQRVQMEMHIQQLTESEVALLQQISALQAELNGLVVESGQARCDAAAARESIMITQQHAVEVAQQLQEANRACSELEQHRAAAVHAEQIAQQELRQAQDKLAELQNEVQRLTSRAQTAESYAEKVKEEAEKQKQLLSAELATLREETTELATLKEETATLRQKLSLLETELAELKLMKPAPAQNGLPPAAINDQHKAAELAKVESVVESLRKELMSAQSSVRDQQEQVTRLQEQLQQYQDKNNDLRTKNWKVMEALQSAEKALQTKSGSALPAQDSLREAIAAAEKSQYNEMVNVLRVACPSAAPSVAVSKDWVHKFADNLKRELVKPVATVSTSTPVLDSSRVEELATQNEHLSGLVDKYKTIIDDTEGVLSRLQQNVSAEEHKWALQLEEKQKELDELRQRTLIQMQKKIDSLQAELQQAKSANHNHSFADAERLTEERLMSVTDKFKLDIHNGPLQTGLEEK